MLIAKIHFVLWKHDYDMRILHACLLAGLVALPGTVSASESMTLIESESSIKFLGTKPDGKEQPGGFKNFKVNVNFDSKNRAASTISIEIDAKSIFTKDEKLTNHLKSPDFFDVRKFPKITFKSMRIAFGDVPGKGTITGQWNMLGKVVEIDVPTQVQSTEKGLNMIASFKIDRTKWGMNYGKGKIHDAVKVDVKFVLKH